eukprot:GFUD01004890.1.p1 GENE.GFUD01004890.1~~GFUD01004890.1.p1  ORF type:complete len:526 (+),score=141.25 GFUD01004890.1:96-1673(+)
MAVRLSLVVLVVLAVLPCSLAQRGRGGQRYRTEEDMRETRRRLAVNRDPRRGDWAGRGRGSRTREEERQGEGLKKITQETTLTYEDSRIFRDLVLKKVYDDKKEDIDGFRDKELKMVLDEKQNNTESLIDLGLDIKLEDTDSLRDLLLKKVEEEDDTEITTEQYERDTTMVTILNNESESLSDLSENVNDDEFSEVFDSINEEGSGEIMETIEDIDTPTELMIKKEGKIVTINGRKAVIKKRKRVKQPKNNTDTKPLSEITNIKISTNNSNSPTTRQDNNYPTTRQDNNYPTTKQDNNYPTNRQDNNYPTTRQDNNEQSTNLRAKYPRRLSKEGRLFRVNKRRRQGAATRGQKIDRETEGNRLKLVTPDEKNYNDKLGIQNESQKPFTDLFEVPKLFKDLSFPVQETKTIVTNINPSQLPSVEPSNQLPFNTLGLGNRDFSQFDAQFSQSFQPQPSRIFRRPIQTKTIQYSNTISNSRPRTKNHQPQIRQPRPSPERTRSVNLFRGHPAQRIDMNTGSYSFSTHL